jgi:hypothetical protein
LTKREQQKIEKALEKAAEAVAAESMSMMPASSVQSMIMMPAPEQSMSMALEVQPLTKKEKKQMRRQHREQEFGRRLGVNEEGLTKREQQKIEKALAKAAKEAESMSMMPASSEQSMSIEFEMQSLTKQEKKLWRRQHRGNNQEFGRRLANLNEEGLSKRQQMKREKALEAESMSMLLAVEPLVEANTKTRGAHHRGGSNEESVASVAKEHKKRERANHLAGKARKLANLNEEGLSKRQQRKRDNALEAAAAAFDESMSMFLAPAFKVEKRTRGAHHKKAEEPKTTERANRLAGKAHKA